MDDGFLVLFLGFGVYFPLPGDFFVDALFSMQVLYLLFMYKPYTVRRILM